MNLLIVLNCIDISEWTHTLCLKTARSLSRCCKSLAHKFDGKVLFKIWCFQQELNPTLIKKNFEILKKRFQTNYGKTPFCKYCFRGLNWPLPKKRKTFYITEDRKYFPLHLRDNHTYIKNHCNNVCIYCFYNEKRILPINPNLERYYRHCSNIARKICLLNETCNLFEKFSQAFILYLQTQPPVFQKVETINLIGALQSKMIFGNWGWWSNPKNWLCFLFYVKNWITTVPILFDNGAIRNSYWRDLKNEWGKNFCQYKDAEFGILFSKKPNYKHMDFWNPLITKSMFFDVWICEKKTFDKENSKPVPGKYNNGYFYSWLENIIQRFFFFAN